MTSHTQLQDSKSQDTKPQDTKPQNTPSKEGKIEQSTPLPSHDTKGVNPFLVATLKMAFVLGFFACATVALCILTYHLTLSRIEANRALALEAALIEVMPRSLFDNNILTSTSSISSSLLGYSFPVTAYRAEKNGRATGLVFPIAALEGYGGSIGLLVGIDRSGTLTGVRVLPPHPETPGLGDKIERSKSDWILTFTGKSLKNTPQKDWAVKKDGGQFDSFTGATITPRAVIKGVYQALEFFDQSGLTLLDSPEKHQIEAHE